MSQYIDVVEQFLQQEEWKYDRPEASLILTGVKGENGSIHIFFTGMEGQSVFSLLLKPDFTIPEGKRSEIAEFITRANYGLLVGGFAMDFSDGDLRYAAAIDMADGELTPSMIRSMLGRCVGTLDRYVPGIMQVLYANIPPKDAIHTIEG